MRSRLISHISKPSVGIRAVLCVSTLRISNVANVNFIIIVKFSKIYYRDTRNVAAVRRAAAAASWAVGCAERRWSEGECLATQGRSALATIDRLSQTPLPPDERRIYNVLSAVSPPFYRWVRLQYYISCGAPTSTTLTSTYLYNVNKTTREFLTRRSSVCVVEVWPSPGISSSRARCGLCLWVCQVS